MKTQNTDIPFNNYVTIFNVLTADCAATETTCINSECTPSKKEVCQSVEMGKGKPEGLKQNLLWQRSYHQDATFWNCGIHNPEMETNKACWGKIRKCEFIFSPWLYI